MNRSARAPKARRTKLVVKELANEILIYDEDNHQAHCLNQTAAFVWKHCDGRSLVPKLARLAEAEMNIPIRAETVWLALKQLAESHLLETKSSNEAWFRTRSRRELIRTLGLASIALPVITSIVAPTVAQAATCQTVGQSCTGPGQGTPCTALTFSRTLFCAILSPYSTRHA